ncbi:hypothetical protein AX16_008597 [Volvariella volvacea WC 439]|nr:hypothetical protein AX16_008597 [Volvariella volvacea WC 439]
MLSAIRSSCSTRSYLLLRPEYAFRLFHSTPSSFAETSRKHLARAIKKANNLKKQERLQAAQANRPHVVLGTRPGEEDRWKNCDLAKVLVDEQELVSSTELQPAEVPVGTVYLPKQIGFGIGEEEKKMLFKELPVLSAQANVMRLPQLGYDSDTMVEQHDVGLQRELKKANNFAKLLDLRNANAAGIAYENRKRIIEAFSTPENPFDPGRSEVQAALLTYKIRKLWSHLTEFKRDVGNRRGLRKLVHQRAKILKYLKRENRDRYDTLLERLALEPEAVEGELVV